jgi:1-acyl-sn-glycerol-3-phosphate acyltransferase
MDRLRAAALLALIIPFTFVLLISQLLAVALGLRARKTIPVFYHRKLCRIMGARIKTIGTPVEGSVLMTANHAGWLDILVLSTVRPLSFIAKDDIASWPVFGLMAKLQETIFVRRGQRSKVAEDRDVMRARLLAGDALVIFPEGTSTDGNRVRRFKSSLFGAAELPLGEDKSHHITHPRVQPVSVAYVRLYGIPMGSENRPFFAWYGDMDLLPHFWEALKKGPIDVVIEFHPPLTVDDAGGRKALAAAAETAVRKGLARALHSTHRPEPKKKRILAEDAHALRTLAELDQEAEPA